MPDPPTIVFGTDHSPWTQAVLLGLAAHGRSFRLQPHPPSLGAFFKMGFVMPSADFGDGQLIGDSFCILSRVIEGPGRSREVSIADQGAMERLFLAYALDRVGPGRWARFVQGWARKRDVPQRPTSIALRALLCWYFFILIALARIALRRRGLQAGDGPWIRKQLDRWNARLGTQPFLHGQQPGVSDYGLLGQMECMASGLTDWTLPLVNARPHLVAWLSRMHARVEGHSVVHSRRVFDVNDGPERASRREVGWFYLWFWGWLILTPITALVLAYAFVARGWNPNRSGERIRANVSASTQPNERN